MAAIQRLARLHLYPARTIWALAIAFAWFDAAPAARAALDPETKVPYRLRVVLGVADHPDFTDHFRRELKRDLQGNLQAALGALAAVEVVDLHSIDRDKWEPLWKRVEEKGLESLDSHNEIGNGKTHFLQLDYRDGRYELQARQIDGTSGFATPLVRKMATYDRGFISRLAGLMIGQDFGIVATLAPAGAGQNVFLRIKGGELGSVDKWLKKGEVFAVVQIRSERRKLPVVPEAKGPPKVQSVLTGSRVEGTLLQVVAEPRDGTVACKLFSRYEEPLPRGAIGYRCVKLGTAEAPLQLQLTDAAGAPHKGAALQVYARAEDFPEGGKETDQLSGRDGTFVSKTKFAHVAFVRVMLGNRRISRIPVEILDDRVEVRSIQLDPEAERRDRLDSERRGIVSRITDGRLIQVRCFEDISAFEQAGKKQQAFERGQSVLKSIDAIATDLREEIDQLLAQAAKVAPKAIDSFADCDRQLQTLRAKQDELRKHLDLLKTAIADENDPLVQAKRKQVEDLLRKAMLLEAQAEYDQALTAYEQALAEAQNEPTAKKEIEKHLQKLKEAWPLKKGDAAHAAARKYIYETWPKLGTLQNVRDELANARKAFEKCKSVGDWRSVNKMHLASVEVATRFGDELKKLIDSAMEEEDKKALETYQRVNEDLQKLLREAEQMVLKNNG